MIENTTLVDNQQPSQMSSEKIQQFMANVHKQIEERKRQLKVCLFLIEIKLSNIFLCPIKD